jgi:hypothetical protein
VVRLDKRYASDASLIIAFGELRGGAMRKRRKSIARWSFLVFGLVLFLCAGVTILLFGAKLLPPQWQLVAGVIVERARDFLPTDEQLKWAAWIGGILLSLGGAALTLLATWHFSEINLPQRIEDLKKANMREHLLLQPQSARLLDRNAHTDATRGAGR